MVHEIRRGYEFRKYLAPVKERKERENMSVVIWLIAAAGIGMLVYYTVILLRGND